MYNCTLLEFWVIRVLKYACKAVFMLPPLSFFGENFRTFLTAQHIFHHFCFTTLHNIRKMG